MGFTKKYGIKTLVYFEPHEAIADALQRVKNIKHWSREWKIDLITRSNPDWRYLYDETPLSADDGLPGQARQ